MNKKLDSLTILIADDDEVDCMLAKEALEACHILNPIHFVHDGDDLLRYLRNEADYKDVSRPGLILLDLKMPGMNGHEALKEIKGDDNLKGIPVIVMTTSNETEDIKKSYELGAASHITKPIEFEDLVAVMKRLKQYWFEIVQLPSND